MKKFGSKDHFDEESTTFKYHRCRSKMRDFIYEINYTVILMKNISITGMTTDKSVIISDKFVKLNDCFFLQHEML